jgi:hypothetical protein
MRTLKMFAPKLCAWWKNMRTLKKELKNEKMTNKMKIKSKRKQLNDYRFQKFDAHRSNRKK